MGGHWDVETGRRDGNVSNMIDALLNLIPPSANISTLKAGFSQRGLSAKDLVVLSGIFLNDHHIYNGSQVVRTEIIRLT